MPSRCSARRIRWRKPRTAPAARGYSAFSPRQARISTIPTRARSTWVRCLRCRWASRPYGRGGDVAGRDKRTVFFLSDRTGITAEMLGNSLLTQFEEFDFQRVTIPFVDSPERVQEAIRTVNEAAAREAHRPLVISSVVDEAMSEEIRREANGLTLDLFQVFIQPLEAELGAKSS